jgi:hypothetical protein
MLNWWHEDLLHGYYSVCLHFQVLLISYVSTTSTSPLGFVGQLLHLRNQSHNNKLVTWGLVTWLLFCMSTFSGTSMVKPEIRKERLISSSAFFVVHFLQDCSVSISCDSINACHSCTSTMSDNINIGLSDTFFLSVSSKR